MPVATRHDKDRPGSDSRDLATFVGQYLDVDASLNDLQKLFIVRVPLPRGDATACPEDANRAPIEGSELSELDFPETRRLGTDDSAYRSPAGPSPCNCSGRCGTGSW